MTLLTAAFSLSAAEKPSAPRAPARRADPAAIERLVRQLGSDRFDEREAAGEALKAIGDPALPALRTAQKDRDPEIRRRADELVQMLLKRRAPMRAKAWRTLTGYPRTGYPLPDDGELTFLGMVDNLDLLQWLDDVELLRLVGEKITDTDLVHLKWLYRLQDVSLEGTKVTDAGLAQLKDITTLTGLGVSSDHITEAGLRHFRSLKNLRGLNLHGPFIRDAALDQVAELRELRFLNLSDTKVTDKGLLKLKGLRKLETLYLQGTRVTDEGVAELLKALPTLRDIRWGEKKKPKVAGRGY